MRLMAFSTMALEEWDGIFCVHGIGEGKEDQIVPSNSEFF